MGHSNQFLSRVWLDPEPSPQNSRLPSPYSLELWQMKFLFSWGSYLRVAAVVSGCVCVCTRIHLLQSFLFLSWGAQTLLECIAKRRPKPSKRPLRLLLRRGSPLAGVPFTECFRTHLSKVLTWLQAVCLFVCLFVFLKQMEKDRTCLVQTCVENGQMPEVMVGFLLVLPCCSLLRLPAAIPLMRHLGALGFWHAKDSEL